MTKQFLDPMNAAWNVIGGKWKFQILYCLMDGTKRFNELRSDMPKITQRMLSNALKDLEESGMVRRKVYAEVPVRVEYCLTELGKSMEQMLESIKEWGHTYQKSMTESNDED